jgi:hypothetical protein
LRDGDGKKSNKHTDVDQLLDIPPPPPPNVPFFSDIKDSDDETPSKSYPRK